MLVLTFQTGSDRLALDVRRVREVVPRVRLQPVACGPPWLAGVFVYRGQVVPVVDLHRLLGGGECQPQLSARIILVPQTFAGGERLVGLLAARVDDVREMPLPAHSPTHLLAPGQPDLGPVLADGAEVVRLVDVDRLLPQLYEREPALAPRDTPA